MIRQIHAKPIHVIYLALGALMLQGCHHLPADFRSRSLSEKISIYEEYIEKAGHDDYEANLEISWHGVPAANAMALYLSGEKNGIAARTAIDIIKSVQLRGCSLKGTAAQKALVDYITRKPSPPSYYLMRAKNALEVINDDSKFENYDGLPPGPCDENK